MLQNRIEQLEQLLEENHEIISHIKDSVLELTANAEGPPALLPYHTANGSWAVLPEPRPSFFSVSPQDCQFALGGRGQKPELQVRVEVGRDPLWLRQALSHIPPWQMLTVSEDLPFDNVEGGVWRQGFDISYSPNDWDTEDLQVFVVPHSHNDPGKGPAGPGHRVWGRLSDDRHKEGVTEVCGIFKGPCIGFPQAGSRLLTSTTQNKPSTSSTAWCPSCRKIPGGAFSGRKSPSSPSGGTTSVPKKGQQFEGQWWLGRCGRVII